MLMPFFRTMQATECMIIVIVVAFMNCVLVS